MLKNIKLLYLVSFFSSFRFFSPILVIYFAHVTGSYALAMTLIAADSLFTALWEVPTGIFSDFIGRKKTLVLSLLVAFITLPLWAFSNNFWFLLLGTVFSGLAGALSSGNNDALLYDSLKSLGKTDDYHKYYGKTGSYMLMGFGVSSLIGGFLATISFQLTFLSTLIFQFIAVILSLVMKNPPQVKQVTNPYKHLSEASKQFVTNPKLRLLTLGNSLNNAINESGFQFFPIFVNTLWPVWAIGILRAGNNFANSLSYFISGRVISRFQPLNALMGQFAITRTVLIIAYGFPTIFSPALSFFTSFIYGIGQVSQSTLLQKEFTDHQRATMGSLESLLGKITFAVVSVFIGIFADILGPRNILLISEICLIPVLFIYWRLFLHHKTSR